MVILYIYSTCWRMKLAFYECQQAPRLDSQSSSCTKKEWEMADVCRLHKPRQGMPKGSFPSPRINQVVHLTVGCELLSFLDAYSGYHQIPLTEVDQPATTFITPFGCFCYVKKSFRLNNAGATYQ
jgi:hypothetical protein